MKNKKLQERNEQIALMLGAIYSSYAEAWGFGNAKNIGSKMFDRVIYEDVIQAERFEKELKFHSDWNWLMEAVEFIESKGYEIGIFANRVEIITTIEENRVYETGGKTKKEAVFIAVSDFARQFNLYKL